MTTAWIVTACRDRCAITARFLDLVAAQSWRPLQLVAVDDGSTDGTGGLLGAERRFPLDRLRGDGRLFWGGAMALALRRIAARGPRSDDAVVFCNDDVRFAPDFLARGLAALAPGGPVLAMGLDPGSGQVIEGGQVLDWRLRPRPPRPGEAIACAPTRGLFVRWDDVLRVGNFAAHRLPHYLSDYEWTWRATRRGLRIRTVPGLTLTCEPQLTGARDRRDVRGMAAWRRMASRTYAENPRDLARFAARVAPWPRAAAELLLQLARWAILPLRSG